MNIHKFDVRSRHGNIALRSWCHRNECVADWLSSSICPQSEIPDSTKRKVCKSVLACDVDADSQCMAADLRTVPIKLSLELPPPTSRLRYTHCRIEHYAVCIPQVVRLPAHGERGHLRSTKRYTSQHCHRFLNSSERMGDECLSRLFNEFASDSSKPRMVIRRSADSFAIVTQRCGSRRWSFRRSQVRAEWCRDSFRDRGGLPASHHPWI